VVSTLRFFLDILFAVRKLSEFQFRLLGLVPLSFFVAQTVHYWRFGGLGNLLWMCNIGNLLLAIGMFLNHRELIRATAIWTIPGLGIWFWYVWLSGSTAFSSTLAHVGGVIVGVLVLRRVRMDRIAWLYAFVWYLLVQGASRVITARELNVNVAHFIQPGWEGAFGSFWKFWIVMTLVVAIALWAIGMVFSLIWPQSKTELPPARDVIASALPPAD
jgi:hypothetical protein